MTFHRSNRGFTLIEMMIAIAVIAIISAIALPFYNDYIETGEEGVLVNNISTIEIFQEDFRLRNGTYAVGLADIAAITAAIGWSPRANDGVTYAIADSDGSFYEVTATNPAGNSVCIQFPARDRC
jgi:type IV pilus assembly protein PilA